MLKSPLRVFNLAGGLSREFEWQQVSLCLSILTCKNLVIVYLFPFFPYHTEISWKVKILWLTITFLIINKHYVQPSGWDGVMRLYPAHILTLVYIYIRTWKEFSAFWISTIRKTNNSSENWMDSRWNRQKRSANTIQSNTFKRENAINKAHWMNCALWYPVRQNVNKRKLLHNAL